MIAARRIVAAVLVAGVMGCGAAPARGRTVLFASGADLQTINPLLVGSPGTELEFAL